MKKKRKTTLIVLSLIFFALLILVFRPVPIPTEEDCLIERGRVLTVFERGEKDVNFRLHGDDRVFYLNRGQERGLNLKVLQAQLLNKEVIVKYPKYWTPLDPFNKTRHVSKLEFEGRTVFTEI